MPLDFNIFLLTNNHAASLHNPAIASLEQNLIIVSAVYDPSHSFSGGSGSANTFAMLNIVQVLSSDALSSHRKSMYTSLTVTIYTLDLLLVKLHSVILLR